MKKFLVLLTVLISLTFSSCVTLPGSDKSEENPQVTAGKIEVYTEVIAEQLKAYKEDIEAIQREVTTIDSAIDGMYFQYKIKENEASFYKARYEKTDELYKELVKSIIEGDPEGKKNLKKVDLEAYKILFEEEE